MEEFCEVKSKFRLSSISKSDKCSKLVYWEINSKEGHRLVAEGRFILFMERNSSSDSRTQGKISG